MRRAVVRLGVGLCLVAAIATRLLPAQEVSNPSGLWNTPLPDPPEQKTDWIPPKTTLPDALVTATAELFRQGLADPRGCEYRGIVLAFEKVENPNAQGALPPRPATHGWVLPAEGANTQRYAVCWNGLVYPVLEVGEPADLVADMKALVAGVADVRAAAERENRPFSVRYGDPYHAIDEFQTVHQSSLDPTKVVLLLRLGRAELAQELWAAALGWGPGAAEGSSPGLATRDPYLTFAFDWTWQLLDRAASAHARGDDSLALETCRKLKSVEHAIEETQRQRERRYAQVEDNRLTVPIPFLRLLPALLADQARRARRPRAPDLALAKDQAERIDSLIQSLDEVGRGSSSSPGGWGSRGQAANVSTLVTEGEAAVPALLDCLEFDDRLTRVVVHDDRHRSRYLHIQGVSEVAFEALTEILGTREFGRHASQVGPSSASREARHAMAADIRAYWQTNRGKSPQQKLFDTLADDRATAAQWLDASIRLTRPADIAGTRYSYLTPPRQGGAIPPPYGEPLRGRTEPTLTELLAKRVQWLDPGGPIPRPGGGGIEYYAVFQANDMALDQARWDLHAALPTLRQRVARCAGIVSASEGGPSRYERFETDIAAFTLLRHQGGDPGALDDYASWIITLSPEGWSFLPISLFEPLWRFSDVPAVSRAAEALFASPDSPWVPLFQPRQRGWSELGQRDDMICSPLLGAPSFRALVLKGLADDRVTSNVSVNVKGAVEIQVDPSWTTRPIPYPGEPVVPAGSTGTLRLKDLYAWKLSQVAGFPRFEMYWPEPQRDAAIARCVEYLNRYGERLTAGARKADASEELPTWHRHDRARLVFEPLGRPATEVDVREGRAIFSLAADEAESVRLVALPQVPLAAEWVKSTASPFWSNSIEAGKPRSLVQYNRGGHVWQAEARRTEAGWQRIYGFVGANTMQGVPAEEIRFPADWRDGWTMLNENLEARLTLPGTLPFGLPRARVGEPLPMTLSFRNRAGLDTRAPVNLGRGGSPPALREGTHVSLFHVIPTKPDEPPSERPLELQPVSRFASEALQIVAPAEHVAALEIELRDLFAIEEPGFYHVVLELDGLPPDSGLPPNATVEARFTID
jgi:hypothetical protein